MTLINSIDRIILILIITFSNNNIAGLSCLLHFLAGLLCISVSPWEIQTIFEQRHLGVTRIKHIRECSPPLCHSMNHSHCDQHIHYENTIVTLEIDYFAFSYISTPNLSFFFVTREYSLLHVERSSAQTKRICRASKL